MSKPIIELAIRTPKVGVAESDFIRAKNAAVKALVSLKGIGPEREFEPFNTVPAPAGKLFVGMTRYASQGKVYRAMMSPSFMLKLLSFAKMMDPLAGIFIKPEDDNFDYQSFANKQNVTEIALLRPKNGIAASQFLAARNDFLTRFNAEPEIVTSYTFQVTGGFKNKDTYPHFTIYRDKAAFDSIVARFDSLHYRIPFFQTFDAALITFCTTK